MTISPPSIKKRSSSNRYDRIGLNEPLSPDTAHSGPSDLDAATPMAGATDAPSFVVIVLDGMQRRFRVPASPDMDVARLKDEGFSVHHVPSASQRLIYRGRMLRDGTTLRESGIDATETIVHLFPKPNVVFTNEGSNNASGDGVEEGNNGVGDDVDGDRRDNDEERPSSSSSGEHGAHVPRIVLDAEEARRTSSMVLFTSSEMFEAQARVKLLSFFLLFVCSMELLSIASIALASTDGEVSSFTDDVPPGDPTDADYRAGSRDDEVRAWRNSDWFDAIVSALGFYAATLGIRATTENTSVSAKRYYRLLLLAGLGWVSYYYYIDLRTERQERKQNEHDNNGEGSMNGEDSGNLYVKALFMVSVPAVVWLYCFLRAWQYQRIILEAELEAEERHDRFLSREHEQDRRRGGDPSAAAERDNSNDAAVAADAVVVAYGGDSSAAPVDAPTTSSRGIL